MKKSVIIPAVLFVAVFCVSFFCQRYSLIYRENIGLFVFTPDWLREVFSNPMPLSNLMGSFLVQFYAEPILGPMIPAAQITIIHLCLSSFLCKCNLPFHRLSATVPALTVWCLTSNLSSIVAQTAAMLISLLLFFVGCFLSGHRKSPRLWEVTVSLALIVGAAIFVSQRKETKSNEYYSRVTVSAGKALWNDVLFVATPDKMDDNPLLLPYATLALNGQARLSEVMFLFPVSGVDCLDLEKENNAVGHLFQSFLFETLGVPNEAIHHMFQFSANFNHSMTHLSLCRLIRLNIAAGNYKIAVKYAEILKHNLYYRYQAKRIIDKYERMEDLSDSAEVQSSMAPVMSYDSTTDIIRIVRDGKGTPVVLDRLLAYLLLELNLEDFQNLFYDYDWKGKRVPTHYQEALLMGDRIREDVTIDKEIAHKYQALIEAMKTMDAVAIKTIARGTFWEYYYRNIK